MGFNYWQSLEEEGVYHIYNKAISNLALFEDEADYKAFLFKYQKYFLPYFNTYAYCLIPNHFHLLIKVKSKEEILNSIRTEKTSMAANFLNDEIPLHNFLADQFRRFFSSLVLSYNLKYNREGAIFVKKYKRIKVSTIGTIQYLLCYIHHNPIHHGLVTEYSHWKYSSYTAYMKPLNTNISKEEVLTWLGGKPVFDEIHRQFKLEQKEINLE